MRQTTVWFKMQKESKPEKVVFSGYPSNREINYYFEEQCGGVYQWWI